MHETFSQIWKFLEMFFEKLIDDLSKIVSYFHFQQQNHFFVSSFKQIFYFEIRSFYCKSSYSTYYCWYHQIYEKSHFCAMYFFCQKNSLFKARNIVVSWYVNFFCFIVSQCDVFIFSLNFANNDEKIQIRELKSDFSRFLYWFRVARCKLLWCNDNNERNLWYLNFEK